MSLGALAGNVPGLGDEDISTVLPALLKAAGVAAGTAASVYTTVNNQNIQQQAMKQSLRLDAQNAAFQQQQASAQQALARQQQYQQPSSTAWQSFTSVAPYLGLGLLGLGAAWALFTRASEPVSA